MGKSTASTLVAGVVGLPLALVVVFAAGSGGSAAAASSQPPLPSSAALSSIPPTYLDLYQAAAVDVLRLAVDHSRGHRRGS